MANPENCDLTEDRIFFLGTGLIYRCVCAPKTWAAERVSDEVTAADPPGTQSNRWVVADIQERPDNAFDNKLNEPCPDDEHRQHWLLNC